MGACRPRSDVVMSRRFDNAMIVDHGHHPLLPARMYPNLAEGLIQPDIKRLEQTCAAAGDVNYLDAQILDRCDNQAHQVTVVGTHREGLPARC